MKPLVAGAALALLTATGPPALARGPADDPLGQARRAAQDQSFAGQVELHWADAGGRHVVTLEVRAASGSLVVSGVNTVMAAGERTRLVRHAKGGWDLLWSGDPSSVQRPDPSNKYDVEETGSTAVAGRPARVVEVRQGDVLLQRLALDEATHLLLRREQLRPDGDVERVVTFTTLTMPGSPEAMPAPTGADDQAAESLPPAEVSPPFSAPETLPDGYQRIGVYRVGGVMQVLYSDGLYDLSVFEQRGRLDRGDVPASGRRLPVGGARGWTYSWAGGQVLLWHAGRTVYTMVSDAPVDHLVKAAASLPTTGRSPSLVDRLRRACRSLVTL